MSDQQQDSFPTPETPVESIPLGRLFEVGMNAGILASLFQGPIQFRERAFYQRELQRFKGGSVAARLCDLHDIIDPADQLLLRQWMVDFLRRGWLSGYTLVREYLQTIAPTGEIIVPYFQANFGGDNSFELYPDIHLYPHLLSSFGPQVAAQKEALTAKYKRQGEFLRADTLALFERRKGRRRSYAILCIDESIYWAKSMKDLYNITDLNELRTRLRTITNTARARSVFSRLHIETGQEIFHFPESLRNYFSAFSRSDKESAKMIQAGSYAYSFYNFLLECGYLTQDDQMLFNVLGWSDQGFGAMAIDRSNLSVLQACYQIYSGSRRKTTQQARQEVMARITRNTKRSFPGAGHAFIDQLSSIIQQELARRQTGSFSEQSSLVITHLFEEHFPAFCSTSRTFTPSELLALKIPEPQTQLPFRKAHSRLIIKALREPEITTLFLTANPGAGKTYTIVEHLLEDCVKDGFLFVYASPRKQVNQDIIRRFQEKLTGRLRHDSLLTLNCSSTLIENYGPSVEYRRNAPLSDADHFGIHFVSAQDGSDATSPLHRKSQDRLQRANDEMLIVGARSPGGVLKCLCTGIYATLEQQLARCIVATVSIQSLKRVVSIEKLSTNTLVHFQRIFKGIYNERDGEVNRERARQLRDRIRTIIFMIDEITGDDSGVAFALGLEEILTKYGLTDPTSGFTTKMVIADASLVGPDVIHQHFTGPQVEPDKIFFKRVANPSMPILSMEPYPNSLFPKSVVINGNSYPAGDLLVRYHISLLCPAHPAPESALSEALLAPNMRDVTQQQQRDIEDRVIAFLQQQSRPEQMIVYIQNKLRLFTLIERIDARLRQQHPELEKDQRCFQRGRDYLEIHADIASDDQQEISTQRDNVRVIFMTSSASRGLSFSNVRHILVDVPRFDLARNLMEIVQVVYRGRGDDAIDQQQKTLTFYLSEYVSSGSPDLEPALQECVLRLYNMLLLLKMALLTRIQGCGPMGTDHVQIIPLGGKAISSASSTVGETIADVLHALAREIDRRRDDTLLREVFTALKQLCRHVDTEIEQEVKTRNTQAILSPQMMEQLSNEGFFRRIEWGLHHLLTAEIEPAYVDGEFLIVPLEQTLLKEFHLFRLAQEIQQYANRQLIQKMHFITQRKSTYTEQVRTPMYLLLELIKHIVSEEVSRTQHLQQKTRGIDRYYALPLSFFTSREAFAHYFSHENTRHPFSLEDWLGDDSFLNLLRRYIHARYPVDNVLPVSADYSQFPFLLFRSASLREARKNMFTSRYLLTSNEFNILNVILSRDED